MRSCDQTCDAEVGILEQFLDRRRHLHLQQPGKNDTTGTDDGNGKNEYSFPEPSATLQDSRTIVDVFLYISRADIRECRVQDGV